MNTNRPRVGVSQCLLGYAVRYDGKAKPDNIVIEQLSRYFELIPVCPEVEAGLGIPRPPVQLTASIDDPSLIGRDDPSIDITGIMQQYCDKKIVRLQYLRGFVFKSRSPSCGLNSAPVFINGERVTETGRGLFAQRLCAARPDLIVIEDTQLQDKKLRERFIQAILNGQT